MNKLSLSLAALALTFATQAPAATKPATKLTDGEITQTLITINEGEIDAGKYAEKQATKPEVKEFAKMMVDTHEDNVKATKAVAKKEGISARANADTKMLQADAKKNNEALKKTDKAMLDKAYVKEQVAMHEKALAKLKDELIPNATNPQLKEHLEKTSQAVAEHLEHAKALESKM